MQNTGLKVRKPKTPVLQINAGAYMRIAFINWWVVDVTYSSTQLSQDFKVSNGRLISKEIPVETNRTGVVLKSELKTWVSWCLVNIVLKSKEKKELLFFGRSPPLSPFLYIHEHVEPILIVFLLLLF